LALVPVGAPSGYVLHVASIHQTGTDASLFENLEQWNPIHPSGFQSHCGYPHCSSQSVKRSRSSVKVANTRTGLSSRPGGTATNISRAPTSIPAAFGSKTGRSSKQSLCFVSAAWAWRPALANYRPVLFTGCSLSELQQRPSCAIEILFQTESVGSAQLLTTALRTELGTTLLIGVLTTHHCHNGLLPLPVAPSQDAGNGPADTSSFSLCPDHRPGPTLLRNLSFEKLCHHRGACIGCGLSHRDRGLRRPCA